MNQSPKRKNRDDLSLMNLRKTLQKEQYIFECNETSLKKKEMQFKGKHNIEIS